MGKKNLIFHLKDNVFKKFDKLNYTNNLKSSTYGLGQCTTDVLPTSAESTCLSSRGGAQFYSITGNVLQTFCSTSNIRHCEL